MSRNDSESENSEEDNGVEDNFVLVKQSVCPACAAPKITASTAFYIYCDYCATFMDTDYRMLIPENVVVAEPDPNYDSFMQTMSQRMIDTREAQDKAGYKQIWLEFYNLQIEKYPQYYPPRIGDEKYRKKFIDYNVSCLVELEFNEHLKRLSDKVSEVFAEVKWEQVKVNNEDRTIISFEDLMNTYKVQTELTRATIKHYDSIGLKYPDKMVTGELAERVFMSRFMEGYMKHLLPDDQEELLKQTGLLGKYHKVLKPHLTLRHCGQCGSSLSVVDGAKNVICEPCGHVIDVSVAEFSCPGCSAPVSLPIEQTQITCPSCSTVIHSYD
ncbi:MAG: hypothetical protein ABUK01_00925 [Leptospirales bacterium]